MPTDLLCTLLAHVVEVQGVNTGNASFKDKPVVLLEYFLKYVSLTRLYLFIRFNIFWAFLLYTSSCEGMDGSFAEISFMRFSPPPY